MDQPGSAIIVTATNSSDITYYFNLSFDYTYDDSGMPTKGHQDTTTGGIAPHTTQVISKAMAALVHLKLDGPLNLEWIPGH